MNEGLDTEIRRADERSPRRSRIIRTPWPAFAVAVAASWAFTISLHLRHSDWTHAASPGLMLVSWLTMTTAMMAPTAVPMLSTLRSMLGGRSGDVWWSFLGAYLLMWAGFAGGASVVQYRLGHLAMWDGDESRVYAASVMLALAGLYQFSSLKARCLRACTHPMQWFLRYWRDGRSGAARMGLRHGATCIGCCWALMALALVGGAAAFAVMVVTAGVMVIEKSPGRGEKWAAPIGYGLLALAIVLAVTVPRSEGGHDHGHDSESMALLD